jgi:FkbM family methyltransferase
MSKEQLLKKCLRTAWNILPKARVPFARAVIHQAAAAEQLSIGVISLGAGLSVLKENGFVPSVVVDIGANRGNWTLEVARVFPSSTFILIDADPANAADLMAVCQSVPRSTFHSTLLGGDTRGDIPFFQMGTGSSVMPELTSADRKEIKLAMTTLDALIGGYMSSPGLIKLDVQGYELEVLRGAEHCLKSAEVVMLECSLLEYNEGAPLFAEVVDFMKDRGFLVYDICGAMRRRDGVLFQADIVFVRENSSLRKSFRQERSEASSRRNC